MRCGAGNASPPAPAGPARCPRARPRAGGRGRAARYRRGACLEVQAGRQRSRAAWQGGRTLRATMRLGPDDGCCRGPTGRQVDVLRQNAMIVLLPAGGFCPPRRHGGPRRPLLGRVAPDNLARGRSTFMVEMSRPRRSRQATLAELRAPRRGRRGTRLTRPRASLGGREAIHEPTAAVRSPAYHELERLARPARALAASFPGRNGRASGAVNEVAKARRPQYGLAVGKAGGSAQDGSAGQGYTRQAEKGRARKQEGWRRVRRMPLFAAAAQRGDTRHHASVRVTSTHRPREALRCSTDEARGGGMRRPLTIRMRLMVPPRNGGGRNKAPNPPRYGGGVREADGWGPVGPVDGR